MRPGAGALPKPACFRGRICEHFPVEKKSLRRLHAAAEKLKAIPHLDEAERLLFARSLLATPQERWEMHENYLRSLNLFSYSARNGFGFKSPE